MAAKGWFSKILGGRGQDERPSAQSTSSSTSTPSYNNRPKPKSSSTSPRTSSTSTAAGSTAAQQRSPDSRGGSAAYAANAQPMSEFMASAMAAAESGMTWENQGAHTPRRERIIDETTALSSLTDQEIARLTEGMQADVLKQPLLTGPVPLLAIRQEYLHGSPAVLRKLEDLEANGWDQAWRARGDGDCFYRSFTLAYLLRILYAPSPKADAEAALAVINATLPSMQSAGFQADLVEEFLDPLIGAVSSFISPSPGNEPTEYSLLQLLQDPEKSNYIVVALRLITGAYIRTHEERFAGFLFSPTTFEPISPEQFAREEVEPCGKEADNVQITALASALRMPVRVAYLDQSQGDDVWLEVGDNAASEDARPLTLLYRPGHFDVVTKDNMQAALAKQEREAVAAATAPRSPTQTRSPPASPASKVRPPQEGLHIVASTQAAGSSVAASPAAGSSAAGSGDAPSTAKRPLPKPPSQSPAKAEPPSPRSTLSSQPARSPPQSPSKPSAATASPASPAAASQQRSANETTEAQAQDEDNEDGKKVTELV